MLANVPRELLLGLVITFLVLSAATIIASIVIVIRTIIKSKKTKNYTKLRHNIITLVILFLATASWILNPGWLRVILTILCVPFIHAIAFFFINNFAATHINKSRALKITTVISYISYIVAYLLFPDFSDVGPMYAFFTLIRSDVLVIVLSTISTFAFEVNVIAMILQIIFAIKAKSKKPEEIAPPTSPEPAEEA